MLSENVPSLHFAVAPVGSVLPVVDLEADAVDFGAVVVGAAAFIAEPLEAGGVAAGAEDDGALVAAPEEELPPAAAF